MQREIKFRAWDPSTEAMFIDVLIGNSGRLVGCEYTTDDSDLEITYYTTVNGEHEDPFIVMQYTGLNDKNGKEIYEGDILSYTSAHPKHEGKVFNNVVEFATGQSLCGWRMRNKSCVVKATPYKFACSEIIGNIFQTPELLSVDQTRVGKTSKK